MVFDPVNVPREQYLKLNLEQNTNIDDSPILVPLGQSVGLNNHDTTRVLSNLITERTLAYWDFAGTSLDSDWSSVGSNANYTLTQNDGLILGIQTGGAHNGCTTRCNFPLRKYKRYIIEFTMNLSYWSYASTPGAWFVLADDSTTYGSNYGEPREGPRWIFGSGNYTNNTYTGMVYLGTGYLYGGSGPRIPYAEAVKMRLIYDRGRLFMYVNDVLFITGKVHSSYLDTWDDFLYPEFHIGGYNSDGTLTINDFYIKEEAADHKKIAVIDTDFNQHQVEWEWQDSQVVTQEPPTLSGTYVKATSTTGDYYPYYAVDEEANVTGTMVDKSWLSNLTGQQKFNIDFGEPFVPRSFRLSNTHHLNSQQVFKRGVKDFTVYGSNSSDAFDNTTYGDIDDLDELGSFTALPVMLKQDKTGDEAWQFFEFDPIIEKAYRYIIIRIEGNWGAGDYTGLRAIHFLGAPCKGALHTRIYDTTKEYRLTYDVDQDENIYRTAEQASDDFAGDYTQGDIPEPRLWREIKKGGTISSEYSRLDGGWLKGYGTINNGWLYRDGNIYFPGDFDITFRCTYNLSGTISGSYGMVYFRSPGETSNYIGMGAYTSEYTGIDTSTWNQSLGSGSQTRIFRMTRVGSTWTAYTEGVQRDQATHHTNPVYLRIQFQHSSSGSVSWWVDYITVNSASNIMGWVGDTGEAPAQVVWDQDYKSVHHLAQDPAGGTDAILDSTTNENHGTPAGTMTYADLVDTGILKALEFDGTDDEIASGSNIGISGTDERTIEVVGQAGGGSEALVALGANTDGNKFSLQTEATPADGFRIAVVNGNRIWPGNLTTALNYIAAVLPTSGTSTSDILAYLNGSSVTPTSTTAKTLNTTDAVALIGEDQAGGANITGTIAEVRISNVARSADEIAYTNDSLTDNLITWADPDPTVEYQKDILLPAQTSKITNYPLQLHFGGDRGITGFNTDDIFNTHNTGKGLPVNITTPPVSEWLFDEYRPSENELEILFTGDNDDPPDPYLFTKVVDTGSNKTFDIQDAELKAAFTNTTANVTYEYHGVLSGDFDIRIPFYLVTVGTVSAYALQLTAYIDSDNYAYINMTNVGSTKYVASNIRVGGVDDSTSAVNSFTIGWLRIIRIDSTIFTYIYNGTTWLQIHTKSSAFTGDVTIRLAAVTTADMTVDLRVGGLNIHGAENIYLLKDTYGQKAGQIWNMTPTAGGPFDNYLAGGDPTSVIRNANFVSGLPFKSVSFWVRRGNSRNTNDNLIRGGTDNTKLFFIENDTDGNQVIAYDGTTPNAYDLTITDLNWHHIVIVEGTNNNSHWVYVDAIKSSTEQTSNMAGVFQYIGRDSTTATGWVPDFTNFKRFDYKLDAAQIRDLYLHDRVQFKNDMLHPDTVLYIESNNADNDTDFWDLSPYAHKVTRTGATHHSADQKKFTNTSIYFDGSSDYLTIPNHSSLDCSGNDWTIQFWYRISSGTGSNRFHMRHSYYSGSYVASDTHFAIADSYGNPLMYFSTGSSIVSLSPGGSRDNRWHHYAFSLKGSTGRVFIDGKLKVTNATLTATGTTTQNFYIGDSDHGAYIDYQGWYAMVQLINGTALYTEEFIPLGCLPSSADFRKIRFFKYTNTWNVPLYSQVDVWKTWDKGSESAVLNTLVDLDVVDSKIVMDFNPSNLDQSNYTDQIQSNPAQKLWGTQHMIRLDMGQDPYVPSNIKDSTLFQNDLDSGGRISDAGLVDALFGKGIAFDGSADWVNKTSLGTLPSNITVEIMFKADTLSNYQNIMSTYRTGSNDAIRLEFDSTGAFAWYVGDDVSYDTISLGTIAADTWYYAVLVRESDNSGEGFLDGISKNTGTLDNPTSHIDDLSIGTGYDASSGRSFDGIVAEFRISTVARSAEWIAANNAAFRDNLVKFSHALYVAPYVPPDDVYYPPKDMTFGFPFRREDAKLTHGFAREKMYLVPLYNTFGGTGTNYPGGKNNG